MYPVYYVVEGDTLPILFHTFDSNDPSASVTLTGLAVTDIEIYKDGNVTQRASDAGYTLLDTDGIDFDSVTGIHGFSIDLSDDTDSGFFSVGPWYHVVVSSVTVDAATINFIAAAFRIVSATRGMAGTALPAAAADAAGGLPISDAGGLDLDGMNTNVSAILTDTAEIGAAGAGLTAADDAVIAAIAALNNISTAQVNAEVVDVLKTDTLTATAQGAPATTPTFEAAIMTLYDALVHGVDVTATLKTFKNDAGTVIWKKTLSDDGTTYAEAESVTGP